MILPDTSIWIDHLRHEEPRLRDSLRLRNIVVHPSVIGEIALGSLRSRELVVASLKDQPCLPVARDDEVLLMIEHASLAGTGIGYADAHLLAAVRIAPGTLIWTRHKRLRRAAEAMQIAAAVD